MTAQSAAQLVLALRAYALEQGLQPVLEGIPNQVARAGFVPDQRSDLQADISNLDASSAVASVMPSGPRMDGRRIWVARVVSKRWNACWRSTWNVPRVLAEQRLSGLRPMQSM